MTTILAHKMPLQRGVMTPWEDVVFGFGKWDRVYEADEVQNIPFTLLDWKASTA
jgi:hypothetical protein